MRDLAQAMAEFAETMASARGLTATCLVVADAACQLIPGVEQASVSLARRDVGIDTVAASGPLPARADAVQVATKQGPCIQVAWDDNRVARLPDTGSDIRWPRFSSRGKELGVGSMLSFQLVLDEADDERIGALNLYHTEPRAFGEESEAVGLLLSVHASVGVAHAERDEQLREALLGRDLIGQAKGLLMARHGVSADTAFDTLVRRSRDTNTRLRDVAAEIVETGAVAASATG